MTIRRIRRIILFTLLMMLTSFGAILAQDEDETQEAAEQTRTPLDEATATLTPSAVATLQSEGFVVRWTSEVIFPAGVRFTLLLNRTLEQLESLSLTVQPEGGRAESFEIDLEDSGNVLFAEPQAEFATIWMLQADNLPTLGGNIWFSWEAADQSGEVARVNDVLVFNDERVTLEANEDPSGIFDLTLPADGPNPITIWREMQPVYDLLVANTGERRTFNVLYYGGIPAGCNRNRAGEAIAQAANGEVVACNDAIAGTLFREAGYDVVQSTSTSTAGAVEAITMLFVERFYEDVWAESDVPTWFTYGLGQFYDPSIETPILLTMQSASRNDQLLSLAQMTTPNAASLERWRIQSVSMVLYIADTYGLDALFDLAERLGTQPFDAAYEAVSGQSINGLLLNFERWLFTDAAVSAFGYTPYQPETPTPTATDTATITRTPSDTPTATWTGAPTSTYTNTPRPTRTETATFTLTPVTPTNTPRPPGSLQTPTRYPAQTALGSGGVFSGPGTLLAAVIGLMLAAGFILIGYARTRREQL
jgi:hypothetical protein